MKLLRRIMFLVLVGIKPFCVSAGDYSSMYTASELKRAHGVYTSNIEGMMREDVAGYLLPKELSTLNRVRFDHKLRTAADPFEFSANPASGVIRVPTFSVKFFDDLAIATAWFERFGCNKAAVFDYVAALDFSELSLPAPLPALKVPDQAYKLDTFVDDVSQKTLKSALVFILLHELGHVHFKHRPYDSISARQAQAQEAEADRFAMRVLRRMHLPPMGMTVWFMAISMRDSLVANSPRQTHPLTASRLNAIANELRTRPGDFIEPANRGVITAATIHQVADDIEGIGKILADPDLRSFLRERGRIVTPALLESACQSKQYDQAWMNRFRHLFE